MPRRARLDEPGSWHHVMNRGIARRTLFERRQDFRYFLAQMAWAVRRGEIEVHAFCLMGNHFHLLVRSPRGELATAMRRIQVAYSRWFNRSRRRDGGLVRGRYYSIPVESLAYRFAVVNYIDENPCKARIVQQAAKYPYGSAACYSAGSGPPWLTRSWIEGVISDRTGRRHHAPGSYERVLPYFSGMGKLVEARLSNPKGSDPLDNLVAASRAQVRAWMTRKAQLADGTQPNMPIIPLDEFDRLVAEGQCETRTIGRGRLERDAWPVVYAGLGRRLCGASLQRLADKLSLSQGTVSKLIHLRMEEMKAGGEYTEHCAALVHSALKCWRDACRVPKSRAR